MRCTHFCFSVLVINLFNLFQEGSTKSAFGAFTGFKTPVTNSSPFSFLANTSTSNTSSTSTSTLMTSSYTGGKNVATNGASKMSKTDKDDDIIDVEVISSTSTSKKTQENEKAKTHSSSYYAKLKGLNESVAEWIKTHVDKNPYCILTPIFKDYEKYLKEITSKEEGTKTRTTHDSELTTQTATSDDNKDASKKKPDSSPFGNSIASTKTAAAASSTAATDIKPEKSIFSNVASSKSIFGNLEQQKFVFGSSTDTVSEKGRSIFGNTDSARANVAGKNIFGNASAESNPFLNKPAVLEDKKTDEEEGKSKAKPVATTFPISTFSFGQSSANNVTAGFSFGG